MDQILATIGDTIGDFFANPVVQLGIQLLFAYLVVVWLATSYWAFRDMQQRTANPVAPYLAAAGIILFTPFFFFFAVWVYKIIRPHEKIGEVWERNLAEEALLAEVEIDPPLPDLRPAGQRGMDHLPDLPDAAEPGLPELQPPGGPRLVAVRVVRQGLRAPRAVDGHARAAPRRPRRDRPHRGPAGTAVASRDPAVSPG